MRLMGLILALLDCHTLISPILSSLSEWTGVWRAPQNLADVGRTCISISSVSALALEI